MINSLVAISNFNSAIKHIQRDYPYLPDRRWLEEGLDEKLASLQKQILSGKFKPESIEYFYFLYEKWLIKAKLSCPDLIIETTLTRFLENSFQAHWMGNCYYKMEFNGQLLTFCRQWKKEFPYIYKTDIQQFFPSINHILLSQQLKKNITDKLLFNLIRQFLLAFDKAAKAFVEIEDAFPYQARKGLPVGIRLSYFLANLYLHDLDKTMIQKFPKIRYGRYMDDIIIFGSVSDIEIAIKQLNQSLAELELKVNLDKTIFQKTEQHITFLRTEL